MMLSAPKYDFYTEGRHEATVLATLQKLGKATAQQLADLTKIPYNSVRHALDRQRGICVRPVHGGWELLPDPQDPTENLFPEKRTLQRRSKKQEEVEKIGQELLAKGIRFESIRIHGSQRFYLVRKQGTEIQPGDTLCLIRNYKDKPMNDYVKVAEIEPTSDGISLKILRGKQKRRYFLLHPETVLIRYDLED